MIKTDPTKTPITIRLDNDIIEHFKSKVHESGGGNYQTLINYALRGHLEPDNKSFEKRLRRSEMKAFSMYHRSA